MPPTQKWTRDQVFVPGKAPVYGTRAAHSADVPSHDHEFVEIVAVLGGSADHVTGDGRHRIGPGDVLVLRPGVWHGYDHVSQLKIYNCCFGEELLRRELAWTLEDPEIGQLLWGPRHGGGAIQLKASPAIIREAITGLGEVHGPAGWAAPIGKLLTFLGTLSQGVRSKQLPTVVIPPRVAEVVRQLEADIARPWRMVDLCELATLSAAHLTRQFALAMGVSPMSYLTRCRAERAAAQLIQTAHEIGDIAVRVGWPDPVYFARRFRQHYGMPPRDYRKRFGPRPADVQRRTTAGRP